MRPWSDLGHLLGRFLGSLSRAEPAAEDVAWLETMLSPPERAQLELMSVQDRRHAVACARRAAVLLGDDGTDELTVAAARHDVGKTDAHLGTFARVGATVLGKALPVSTLQGWRQREGWRRSVAVYLDHDVLGAELLAEIGSDPVVVTWAREHHRDETEWSLPAATSRHLLEADLVSSINI